MNHHPQNVIFVQLGHIQKLMGAQPPRIANYAQKARTALRVLLNPYYATQEHTTKIWDKLKKQIADEASQEAFHHVER